MNRISFKSPCLLIALTLLVGNPFSGLSQTRTTGAVHGRVYEVETGLPIAGVVITIRNEDTGLEQTTVTKADGFYTYGSLQIGWYTITATKEGYVDDVVYRFPIRVLKISKVQPPPFALRRIAGPIVSSPATQPGTGGAIAGDVFDDEKAKGISGAKVTVSNETNSDVRTTITDENGAFKIASLPPGSYRINVEKEGYDSRSIGSLKVNPDMTYTIRLPNLMLKRPSAPTTLAQSPSLAAESSQEQLINTSTPTRGTNFDSHILLALPLPGVRNFDALAFLVPGVAPPPQSINENIGAGVAPGIGTPGQFAVNGLRSRSNSFTIDGSDNTDQDAGVRRQGFTGLLPQPLESIQEFQIATLLWDAELGRNFASQVNAVSRYGYNDYHGQVYTFITDSRLNARNPFDYTGGVSGDEDPFTRTQTGGTFSGPILRDRLQFFSSFERQIISASTEQHFSSPRSDERRFLEKPQFIVDGFLGNFAVTRGATPLGNNILSFYPLPNDPGGPYGTNTYTEILPSDSDGTVFSTKLTYQASSRNSINARYNFTDDSRVLPSINRAIRSSIGSDARSQNLSIILDSGFTPTLINQARFSYGRTRLVFPEYPTSPLLLSRVFREELETEFGPQLFTSETGTFGEIIIDPFSPVGLDASLFPQGRVNNTFQYADTLAWQAGSHSLKFGGDVRRAQLNSFQDRFYRPRIVFGNGVAAETLSDEAEELIIRSGSLFPGVELASLGLPSAINQTVTSGTPNSNIGLRFTEYNIFFNDNWRVRQNLTFDYGLRYEYNTVPRDVKRRIESALVLENLPADDPSVPGSQLAINAFNTAVAAYREIIDGRTKIYDPDRNNVGPHFGLAWAPWADGKMSIRAGYGIYYDTILGAVVSQSRNVFPREIPVTIDPVFPTSNLFTLTSLPLQVSGSSRDFVASVGDLLLKSSTSGGLSFILPERKLRTPYAQQWHLTLEREFLGDYVVSASYVGTRGVNLTRLITPNLGPNVTPNIPLLSSTNPIRVLFNRFERLRSIISFQRPNRALGPYQLIVNSALSKYHALQLESRKRYKQHYMFTVAYTWSHAIDDVSDLFPIAGAPVLAQNQNDLRRERGNASFDVRHRLATSLVWELPFFNDSSTTVSRLLGGWQLTSIFQAQSGQPFTITLPVDANLDGNLTDRFRSTDGLVFFNGHGSRRVALPPSSEAGDFFLLGQNGIVGRNTLRGDSLINLDVALNKLFRFDDTQGVEFRAEFFNLLNRSNFGLPIRVLGAPGFGSSVDTVTPARIVQLAIKYRF